LVALGKFNDRGPSEIDQIAFDSGIDREESLLPGAMNELFGGRHVDAEGVPATLRH